jgi:predicted aconitase
MRLTPEEQDMLEGRQGSAVQKAMQILVALGTIYGAERLIPVASVQVAGVSYDNLGEAGLQFLAEMAAGGGRARVLTTLNPAGMDVENWESLGISPQFAENQGRVLAAFARMGMLTTCTCTPYLTGNLPHFGEHLAWAESSAVCFANSVIGARSNREGGPSALAAALTGRTPEYGYHLNRNRLPALTVEVLARLEQAGPASYLFGALGRAIGVRLEGRAGQPAERHRPIYLCGIKSASLEDLKSFCASLATYAGAALFHMQGITPEAAAILPPAARLVIDQKDLDQACADLNDAGPGEVDFVSLGCPHLTIGEIARLADLLAGKKVRREFWITTARSTKLMADRMGFTQVIEDSGAKFAADTCCVVAPIKGRFKAMATDSAKACYYASSKDRLKTAFKSFEAVVAEAIRP